MNQENLKLQIRQLENKIRRLQLQKEFLEKLIKEREKEE